LLAYEGCVNTKPLFIVESEYSENGIKMPYVYSERACVMLDPNGAIMENTGDGWFSCDAENLTVKLNLSGRYLSISEIEKELEILEKLRNPIGELKRLMGQKRLTQKDVGKLMGCSQANISMSLGGLRTPSDSWIARLQKVLLECT
jgi:hypothetical protein